MAKKENGGDWRAGHGSLGPDGLDSQQAVEAHDQLGEPESTGVKADSERKRANDLAFYRFIIVLLAVGLILSLAGYNALLPLKREVPYLYRDSQNGKGLESFERLSLGSTRLETLAMSEAIEYIRIRHEITSDVAEMERRWYVECKENYRVDDRYCAYIQSRSAQDAYDAFLEEIELRQDAINTFVRQGKIRTVEFPDEPEVHVRPAPAGDYSDIFQFRINFTLIDKQFDPESGKYRLIRTQYWQATLQTAYRADPDIPGDEKFINPSGFMVATYDYRRRGGSSD